MNILQYCINGISIGSIYAIIALGYTMVYGIAKMLNFAHGDIIMVGAYICYCVTNYLRLTYRSYVWCKSICHQQYSSCNESNVF